MSALEIFKATQPYEYYMKFIRANCRPDQRLLGDMRPCLSTSDCINTCQGSSLVKLGATNVLCGISARLCKPHADSPARGFFVCNVDLPALCSSKNFKTSSSHQSSSVSSATVEQTQAMLSQLMMDILLESKCVRDTDLCIKEGKLVWVLYIDLICLNNDGNVQDACCLAMISALKTVQLMRMDYDETENIPLVIQPISTTKLPLYSEPVCTTLFALEDNGRNVILSDPNRQEEDFMKTFVIVCSVDETKMCLMRKLGGFSLSKDQMSLCIDRALQNGQILRKQVYNNSANQENGMTF